MVQRVLIQEKNDESIYENGWSHENTYIAGLIWADGCLSYIKSSDDYQISISTKYKQYANKIRRYMKSDRKVYHQVTWANTDAYSVVTRNKIDVDFLMSYGLSERKSLSGKFPKIPIKYMPQFIAGFFDGDGSVTVTPGVNRPYFKCRFTCGNLEFLEVLKVILLSYDITSSINKDCRRDTWYLDFNKLDNVVKFYNLIYKDKNIFLEYKYDKFNKNLMKV